MNECLSMEEEINKQYDEYQNALQRKSMKKKIRTRFTADQDIFDILKELDEINILKDVKEE